MVQNTLHTESLVSVLYESKFMSDEHSLCKLMNSFMNLIRISGEFGRLMFNSIASTGSQCNTPMVNLTYVGSM